MPLTVATITWQVSRIEFAGHSTWASLAFSPSGQAAVAFHASSQKALRFATLNAAGGWDIESIETPLYGQSFPSLRYRFSQPALSYSSVIYTTPGDTSTAVRAVKYALRRGRGGTPPWTIEGVRPGEWTDTSLAIGPSRKPFISFTTKAKKLAYAYQANPSVWVGSDVDGPALGFFHSIAIAPSGHPAIAYLAPKSGSTPQSIKYAEFDGAHWKMQTVGEGAGWCSLAFAPNGEPSMVYAVSRGAASEVVFAAYAGGAWHREVIASNAGSPSIAFSPAGTLGVSYHDNGAAAVKYAAFLDREWRHVVVDEAGKDANGVMSGPFQLTSLGFSPASDPAIAYYDNETGDIKCAMGTVTAGVTGWVPIAGGLDPSRHG